MGLFLSASTVLLVCLSTQHTRGPRAGALMNAAVDGVPGLLLAVTAEQGATGMSRG